MWPLATSLRSISTAVIWLLLLFVGSLAETNLLAAENGRFGDSGKVRDDLITLTQRPQYGEEVFSQALKIIDVIESSPSCNRLAAVNLLRSCQSLKGTSGAKGSAREDFSSHLDDIKSVYAARLALCELSGAKAGIPRQCGFLVLSFASARDLDVRGSFTRQERNSGGSNQPGLEIISKEQLGQCLKSLESRPQWWTSYSNARQNAVVICEATRTEIEKDDLIAFHRTMAEVGRNTTSGIVSAIRQSSKILARQRTFAESLEKFQSILRREWQDIRNESRDFIGNMLEKFQFAIESTSTSVLERLGKAKSQSESLSQELSQMAEQAGNARKDLEMLHEDAKGQAQDLAALQKLNWDNALSIAVEVQQSLALVNSREIHLLVHTMKELQQSLQSSNGFVMLMHERQIDLDKRVTHLNTIFKMLESQAASFRAAQKSQADAQYELHDSFRSKMSAAHELVTQVSLTASDLQSTVDSTAGRLRGIALFSGIGGLLSCWGLFFLTTIGSGIARNKILNFTLLGILIIRSITDLKIPSWYSTLFNAATYPTRAAFGNPSLTTETISACGLVVLGAVGMFFIYRFARWTLILQRGQSLLPKIEKPELPRRCHWRL